MVKEGNKRVMITCSQKTIKELGILSEFYDMTITELVKFMAHKECQERKLD